MNFVKSNSFSLSLLAGVLVFLGFVAYSGAAEALATPTSFVETEALSVSATPEILSDEFEKKNFKSCTIWNNSATVLRVGGSEVTSSVGFPICTDTAFCPKSYISLDTRSEAIWVAAASGTLTPDVICSR